MPKVISNNMVLQQNQPIKIWGWADPGEMVTVELGKKRGRTSTSATVKTDLTGRWKVELEAQKASGKRHGLLVKGNNEILVENILIGEVWIGSGQSNMEWSLRGSEAPNKHIAEAKFPGIRLFHIPKKKAGHPAEDVEASWKACSPETVQHFSAVLYHFGKTLRGEVKVPIGLIGSSWGGSPIEPWTAHGNSGGGMYNAMIAPVTSFGIRGVIWYQGESNVANGLAYFHKKQALISGWRAQWGHDFPFYFVQLAPFVRYGNGQLPRLWEAQAQCLTIPSTGMAVTTDIVHNLADIHPKNKHDVGKRLALWALAKDYGKKRIQYSGPLYQSMKIDEDKIILSFAHAKGLTSRDKKPLTEFQIAGEDGVFVEAVAKIMRGGKVVVRGKDIDKPKHVRFGWHKAANPNLVNASGLPASPFQTDGWRGGTGIEEKKSKKSKRSR